jgi:hypothetical protein
MEIKDLKGEIWKPLPLSYIDKPTYFASNMGRIKSIDRTICKRIYPGQLLSLVNSTRGFKQTTIVINNQITTFRIHKMIADLFVPNPENKPVPKHKNGDKSNNRADNLEWATFSEVHKPKTK